MGGRNAVADLIADKGWCVADGATGSNFFGRGLEAGYPPELWCLEKPEEVRHCTTRFSMLSPTSS